MNCLNRSVSMFPLVRMRNNKWLLNIFLIKADAKEDVSKDGIFHTIEGHLTEIDEKYMSNEFEYFKTGFAFLHYGRRGVDLTVWHVGRWGKTFEVFSESWYCYNRDIESMTILDNAEPLICQYELLLMCEELKSLSKIISKINENDVFQEFFYNKYKVSLRRTPSCTPHKDFALLRSS